MPPLMPPFLETSEVGIEKKKWKRELGRRRKEREGKRNLCLRIVNGNASPYYPHLWKLLKWELRKKIEEERTSKEEEREREKERNLFSSSK